MFNLVNHSLSFIFYTVIIMASSFAIPEFSKAEQTEQAEDSAIILMYHRFGEEKYPTTNITLPQFDAHLEELKKEKYNIVPLDDIVTALKNKEKLPPRTIAITIDDAYLSIFHHAWPKLKAANFPFTLFVSTKPVSQNNANYMTWQQLRDMASDPLVTIGHHGHTHDPLPYMTMEQARKDIATATAIYEKELGSFPDIFAYPYGEFSPMLQHTLKEMHIKAAFGQFSSGASSHSNLFGLPRFALNEKYSNMDRFHLIVNARALPAYDILPISPVIKENPPQIGFTVKENIRGLSAMSCYPSHLGKAADITRIDRNRVEVRFDLPLPKGRSRINCTMPGPDKRWYWFGLPFFVK